MFYSVPFVGPSGLSSMSSKTSSAMAMPPPQAPKDRKTLEEERKKGAREKAIEIFKASKAKRAKKAALQTPSRIVLPDHNLSESDDSD